MENKRILKDFFIIVGIFLAAILFFLFTFSTAGKWAYKVPPGYDKDYYYGLDNVYYKYGYLINQSTGFMGPTLRFIPLAKKVKGADKNSFTLLKGSWEIWTDKDSVFFQGERIAQADRQTFSLMQVNLACSGYLARDKNFLYEYYPGFRVRPLPEVDVNTFKITSCGNASDKNHVYSISTISNGPVIIPEADPATFQLLGNLYAKDNDHVYYHGKKLDGPNPATTVWIPTTERITDGTNVYDGKFCFGSHKDQEQCSQKIDPATQDLISKYGTSEQAQIVSEDELLKFASKSSDFFPIRNKKIEKDEIIGAYVINFVPQPKLDGNRMETLYLFIRENPGAKTNGEFIKEITPNPDNYNPSFNDIKKIQLGSNDYVKYLLNDGKVLYYKSFSNNYYIDLSVQTLSAGFVPEGIKKIEDYISAITYKL